MTASVTVAGDPSAEKDDKSRFQTRVAYVVLGGLAVALVLYGLVVAWAEMEGYPANLGVILVMIPGLFALWIACLALLIVLGRGKARG